MKSIISFKRIILLIPLLVLLTGCDGPLGEAFEDGDWFYGMGSCLACLALAYGGLYILLHTLEEYSSDRFLNQTLAIFLWVCAFTLPFLEQGIAFSIVGIAGLIIVVINIIHYIRDNR